MKKIKEQKPLKYVREFPHNSAVNDINQPSTSDDQTAPLPGRHVQTALNEQANPTQAPCSLAQERDSKINLEWKAIKPKLTRQSGRASVSHSPYKSLL